MAVVYCSLAKAEIADCTYGRHFDPVLMMICLDGVLFFAVMTLELSNFQEPAIHAAPLAVEVNISVDLCYKIPNLNKR